jgi:MFS family permease
MIKNISAKKIGAAGLCGIFLTSLLQGGSTNINPGLDGISVALGLSPDTVSLVGTLPALFAVVACLFIGRFAGREIRYRTIMIVSLVLSIIAGAFPMLFPRNPVQADVPLYWGLILVSRAIVGACTGAFFTLPAILIQRFYEGGKQKTYLGITNAFGSASGLPTMLAVGALVDINWTYIFGIYLAGIVPLFLILFFLPEPPILAAASPLKVEKQKNKFPLPVKLNFILIFFAFVFWGPALLFMSNIITSRGLGSGFESGIISIMFDISPILLSACLKPLYSIFKKYLIVIALAVSLAGIIIVYQASSLFMAGLGMFLLGFILLLIPALILDNRPYLKEEQISPATSGLTLCLNLGIFAAGPFSSLAGLICGNMQFAGLFFACLGMAILFVVFLLIRIFQKTISAP